MFGCTGSSLPFAWAFSSCSKWGLLFAVIHRLLTAVASHCGAQALGAQGSVVAGLRLI